MKYLTVDISEILIKKMEVQRILSRNNLTFGIVIVVSLLAVMSAVISLTNLAWAATIQCGANTCFGTTGSDTMIGDNGNNVMAADKGNDIMSGKDGKDVLLGADGDDNMSGGAGDDQLCASEGADRITGGDANDLIFHSGCDPSPPFTDPDGSRDVIDCGSGTDEAWINVNVDHDIVTNCEIVHSG